MTMACGPSAPADGIEFGILLPATSVSLSSRFMTKVQEQATRHRREPLWQRAAVKLLAAGIWTVSILPSWLAYAIGDLIAVPWFLWWLVHDRRGLRGRGYWRNTRIAFRSGTPLGAIRPKHHLWRWSRHMAWTLIDFCRLPRLTASNWPKHCDLTEYPQLAELFAEGKGIIFVTGHIGPWDVAGYGAGLLGLPITSVYRPSPLPGLNRLIERLRSGKGQTLIGRKRVMWTLKKALANNETIALVSDGGAKHNARVAPFLGVHSLTVGTPALLHLATGSPIAVLAMHRVGRMRFRLRVYDIIRDGQTGDREQDVLGLTARINGGLSAAICETPEQWFWQSRRFLNRPHGEQPDADGLPPVVATAATVSGLRSQQ